MAQQGDRRGRTSVIVGNADAPRTVILFHGYTGSTDDFGALPDALASRLNARVIVPILPGHGTRVEDLLPFDFETFLETAQAEVAHVAGEGRPFAIGGHSFGAYLAILTAVQYPPAALFTTVIPYQLRFPYSNFIGRSISRTKTLWKKHLPKDEWEARTGAFFYKHMPGKALSLVNEGNRRIEKLDASFNCPMLSVHAHSDDLAHAATSVSHLARITSGPKEELIVENGRHSIFFSKQDKEQVLSKIGDFLQHSFATLS